MVIKRVLGSDASREEEGVNDGLSEDDEIDSDDDMSEEIGTAAEVEPAPKKLKRDVTKEAEKELATYDEIVKDPEIKFTEKLVKLSGYLESVFENNVNTLEFEINFNDWVKSTLLKLLEEGTKASEEFYGLLCKVLKVAPTIVESTCEKVLTFIFARHHFSSEGNLAFEDFMEQLAYTFEKLRRFPKLIARLLCCVRDSINGLNEQGGSGGAQKFMKKMLGYKSKEMGIFLLPKRFMDSYASIVSMLSAGQIVDLWKMLQHNLEEECIKKYTSAGATSMTCFLTVIVELIVTFLCSIKVVDYSIPTSTVDRVIEMMNKLKENSISELASLLPSEYDTTFTRSFLKLCNGWGHLHNFMCIYNETYKNNFTQSTVDSQQAVDLSFLLPQLSSEEWMSMWTTIDKNGDAVSASYMTSLVALKLKCFAVIGQTRNAAPADDSSGGVEIVDILQKNMQEAATFLWNHQGSLRTEQDSTFLSAREDTLRIATVYLPQDELLEYSKTLLDNILVPTNPASNNLNIQSFQQQLSSNMKFRVALVLESLYEGVKRVGKGNSMKRPAKKFLSECLSPICKVKILEALDLKESKGNTSLDTELKKSMMEAVKIVNDVMKEKSIQNSDDQISAVLVREIISLIGQEELSQYPKIIKTIILLSSMLIFTSLVKHGEEAKEIIDELSSILSECGRKSQGNDMVFHINWLELFRLVKNSANSFSDNATKSLCALILENLYVSPKTANDFGDEFIKHISDDDSSLVSTEGYLTICVLDHVLEEVSGTKTKSAPILTSHAKELCSVVVNKLSDGSIITELHGSIHSTKKNKRKSSATPTKKSKLPNNYVSRVLRSCYLLLKGKSNMSPEDASEIAVIVLPYLQFALDNLALNSETIQLENDGGALLNCIQFIIEALKDFKEYREKLPQDFLLRVWNTTCMLDPNSNAEITKKLETELPRLVLEIADESEFQSICDSIMERMEKDSELISTAHVLSSLISSEISCEKKKQIRRSTIELGLYKYLDHIHVWKTSDEFIRLAVPYIQFQTSLLKRRKPMGSLTTLSLCMSSITSLPLDKIQSIDSFKTAFSAISDLLNALNVHRLDVISFRSHVFVQCFQFLVDSLVKRADQRNKLADREIYDLRHCAHCIERVCQSAKLGREELARVSPYLIVILLQQFEKTTVYPIVKNPLLNGCYKLLDMCDDHGVSHVNSMLSTGSREIFKAVYELYKKFYRYKGKV